MSAPVIVHVNQHVIRHNQKYGTTYPTLTCKLPAGCYWRHARDAPKLVYAWEVGGKGRLVDANAAGRKPLDCGARVWMEFEPVTFFVEGPWLTWPVLRARLAEAHDEIGESTAGLRIRLGSAAA